MILLVLVLVVAAVAGTIRLVLRDDRGPAAPPASHRRDATFTAPASLLGRR